MRIIYLLLLTICLTTTANAQTSKADPNDVQGWFSGMLKADLPKKWDLAFEYQNRLVGNLSYSRGSYLSAELNKKLNNIFTATGEFRLAFLDNGTFKRYTIGIEAEAGSKKWEWNARLLLQNQLQDFADETKDTDGFWRVRLQLSHPLNDKLGIFASTEPVMRFGGNYFVDNWRNMVGIKWKIAPHTRLDLSYMYRPDYAKATYNRLFHIIGVQLVYKLPKKKK